MLPEIVYVKTNLLLYLRNLRNRVLKLSLNTMDLGKIGSGDEVQLIKYA